jgi:hypothetical protein
MFELISFAMFNGYAFALQTHDGQSRLDQEDK